MKIQKLTDTPYLIGAFRSRQQVIKFIKDMESSGGKAKVINTPHEVVLGCGLSAAFDERYYSIAKSIIEMRFPTAFIGFYRCSPNGVRLKVEPVAKYFK